MRGMPLAGSPARILTGGLYLPGRDGPPEFRRMEPRGPRALLSQRARSLKPPIDCLAFRTPTLASARGGVVAAENISTAFPTS